MYRFIIFCRAVMTAFLFHPLAPVFSRLTQSKSIGININFSVSFCGSSFNKQIIIAAGNIIVCTKTFMAEENSFFITQVSPNTHVRITCNGIT